MLSHEDKEEQSLTRLKKTIQDTQQKILLIFIADDSALQFLKEPIFQFNRLVQRTLITKLCMETKEEIDQLFSQIKLELKDEVNASEPLKKVLTLVLDWYYLKALDIFLERKENILYKRKSVDKIKEEKQRAALIRRVKDIKDAITQFNTALRKEHIHYQIKKVNFDPTEPNLKKVFESYVREENFYESILEHSPYLLNLSKEREILIKKLNGVEEEVKVIVDGFALKQEVAKKYRLAKVAELMENRNSYQLDVYYLNEFQQQNDVTAQQKIENYKKIQEKNIGYDRICQIKNEATTLESLLDNFLNHITQFYQSMSYMDWLWPGAEAIAVEKIYALLKIVSADFALESKILKTNRDIAPSYRIIQDDVPKFNQIVIDQFIELAVQFTKKVYNKIKVHSDLKKLEEEIIDNQKREKQEVLAEIILDIGEEDIDPIRLKELHRRKLDNEWKMAFQQILTRETKHMTDTLRKLKKNDPFALEKAKDLEGEVFLKKEYIKNQCLVGITSDEKRERIEIFLTEEFVKLKIFQEIKKFIEDIEETKYQAPASIVLPEISVTNLSSRIPQNTHHTFFRNLLNYIKNFFKLLCCCFPFLNSKKAKISLDKPLEHKPAPLSYKIIMNSPVGKKTDPNPLPKQIKPSVSLSRIEKNMEIIPRQAEAMAVKTLTLN